MSLDLDYKYSVDKISLRRYVNKDWIKIMQSIMHNPDVEYYMSADFKGYKHNWNIKTNDNGNFYVGALLNIADKNTENNIHVKLEFNPNKCKNNELLLYVISNIFKNNDVEIKQTGKKDYYVKKAGQIEIQRVDIAIDMPDVHINNLVFDLADKKSYKIFKYPGYGNKTIYLGSRKRDQITIYNKAQEQNLTEEFGFDYDWTRYEISLKDSLKNDKDTMYNYFTINNIKDWNLKKELPRIYYVKQNEKIYKDMTRTDRCLMKGFLKNAFTLDELGRRKKKKLRAVLEKQRITLNKEKIKKTIVNFTSDIYYNMIDE
ncbi:MAG: replication initiation factor domain-containing protein [Candidatus Woesearchaeota archaeon]